MDKFQTHTGVPVPLRRERAQRLRAAGDVALARYLVRRVGSDADALIETAGRGRTEHYAPIAVSPDLAPGSIARVRVTRAAGGTLIADGALVSEVRAA